MLLPFRRPSLKALSTFEAAAAHQSFKLAAEELSLTPSAVSHQVRQLESQLGLQLFHRVGRGLVLTDAGKAYVGMLTSAFLEIDTATRQIMEFQYSDQIVVHSTPSFASRWLIPKLTGFLETHPQTDVRIEATSEGFDFKTGNIDIAIWYARKKWPDDVEYLPLISERIFPMCHPDLKKSCTPLQSLEDLAQQRLIYTQRNIIAWSSWFTARDIDLSKYKGQRVSIDPSNLAIEAAANSVGFVLESDILAAAELESGTLVPAFENEDAAENISYYLVWPKHQSKTPKIEAFCNWIRGVAGTEGAPGTEEDTALAEVV